MTAGNHESPLADHPASLAASISRLAKWLVVAIGILTAAHILWVFAAGTDQPSTYIVAQALFVPVSIAAVLLPACAAYSHEAGSRARFAWALVALSRAAFWAGDALWGWAEAAHELAHSPTWADGGYLLYYPLMLAALILFSARSNVRRRSTTALDMAILFLAGALLAWYFVVYPAMDNLGLRAGDAITIAYQAGDLVLILGATTLAVRGNRLRSSAALGTLLGALIVTFVADLAYGHVSSISSYKTGGYIQTIYLVAWFLFASSAAAECSAYSAKRKDENGAPSVSRTAMILPSATIAIAVVVLVWALRDTFGTVEGGAALAAVLVAFLVMVRQLLVERENSRLRELQATQASEERLQRTLRRTKFSVDRASDAILWLGKGARVLDANEAACRALEYTREEMLGLDIFDIDPLLDRSPETNVKSLELTKAQGSRSFETVYRTKSGRVFPVEVTINYLEYEGDQFICSFARDISRRKEAEQALHEAQAQLQQSQKMDAIGQLAGGVAHDFNNLLTAILGYCEIILASGNSIDEHTREDVEEIKSAADRAALLTQQILSFSRRRALQPQLVEINKVVANIEALLSRTLGEHIDLVLRLDPHAGNVQVDQGRFEQVITNLALNARDAMPQGGRLTIETRTVELSEQYCAAHQEVKPGTYVLLAVSDTGIGMDDETREHAFEPFFTTKEPGKGTGLGLATVYSTVRQSAGTIEIKSQPGHGTTVTILLPRQQESAPDTQANGEAKVGADSALPVASALRPERADILSHKTTVLVVEDEAGIRELVRRVLESHGYDVIPAAEAEIALSILQTQTHPVDMLLTDVILPGPIQGGDLAERALALRPDLPVLYMSGYTRDVVLHSGRLHGEVDLLEKPFAPEALVRKVREILDRA